MGRLAGKVVMITGAGNGMGRAHAVAMAREGAALILTDVDQTGLAQSEEAVRAVARQADVLTALHDVRDEDRWRQLVAEAVARFSRIDVLVNNAGISFTGRVDQTTTEQWDKVMDIDAKGVFLGCREIVPAMRGQGGSIINISSIYGIFGGPYASVYNAAKGAVRLLTKAAAIDLARFDIRVNSVHPGVVRTAMTETWLDDPELGMKQLIDRQIQKRAAAPEEVAMPVVFLASDESSFMTGSELVVDGGFSAQ